MILAALVGGAIFYQHENAVASVALGQALEIYNSSLRQPGEPEDGTYKTTAERAQAANKLFVDVADKYGSFEAGKIAKYFAGLTDIDLGKTADAEAASKASPAPITRTFPRWPRSPWPISTCRPGRPSRRSTSIRN